MTHLMNQNILSSNDWKLLVNYLAWKLIKVQSSVYGESRMLKKKDNHSIISPLERPSNTLQ